MKNLLYLLVFSALFFNFSCSGDDEGVTPPIEGSHVEINDLKAFLASEIKSESNVRYVNPQGSVKMTQIDYKESTEDLSLDGQSYTSDKFTVSLSEGAGGDYLINLVGTATFDSKAFNVLLVPGNGTEPVRGEISYDHINGDAIGSTPNGEFIASMDLGTRTFTDVFKFERAIESSFSELYVNEENGVVAFRDGSNVLWIFDGFQ